MKMIPYRKRWMLRELSTDLSSKEQLDIYHQVVEFMNSKLKNKLTIFYEEGDYVNEAFLYCVKRRATTPQHIYSVCKEICRCLRAGGTSTNLKRRKPYTVSLEALSENFTSSCAANTSDHVANNDISS